MKQVAFLFLCFFTFSTIHAQNIREFNLYFETASYKLSNSESYKINSIISTLPFAPKAYKITIIGHTDNVGNLEYNQKLSENRASVLAKIFEEKGFNSNSIFSSAKAYLEPLMSNFDKKGRAENRRVTVIISMNLPKVGSLGGFRLKEQMYTINTAKKEVIDYKSGSKISIPENAFEDVNGLTITGFVDLSYIEYRDPIEYILGNIAMDHIEHGENTHFNSAGMYKIQASQNGKPIFLKPGKNINIIFPLVANLPNLNFYKYDTISNKWSQLATLETSKSETDSNKTASFNFSKKDSLYKINRQSSRFDTIEYANICNSAPCTISRFLLQKGTEFSKSDQSILKTYRDEEQRLDSLYIKQVKQFEFNKKIQDSLYLINNKKEIEKRDALIKTNQELIDKMVTQLNLIPEKIRKTTAYYTLTKSDEKNNALTFTINFKALYNIETTDFNTTLWIYNTANGALTENLFLKKWNSCVIKALNEVYYTIILKDDVEEVTISNVKISNNNLSKKDEKAFIAALNSGYQIQSKKIIKLIELKKNLALRIKNIRQQNIALEKSKEQKNYNPKNNYPVKETPLTLNCFWEKSKEYMNTSELSMSITDWFAYFDAHKTIMLQRYSNIELSDACKEYIRKQEVFKQQQEAARQLEETRQKAQIAATKNATQVTQSLNISSLGIYNCDQISRLEQPVTINATYQDETGNALQPLFIYLVDSAINGILRYDGYNGYSPYLFAYSPKSSNTLLAFDDQGNAFIMNSEKFKEATNQARTVLLRMKKIENIKSKEELQALF